MDFITCNRSLDLTPKKLVLNIPKLLSFFFAFSFLFAAPLFAAPKAKAVLPAAEETNVFAQQFFMPPEQKLRLSITEIQGLAFLQTPDRAQNAQYAIVTDFEAGAVRSRAVPDSPSFEELEKWAKKSIRKASYQGVEIKKVTLPAAGGKKLVFYWVGHKAFKSNKEAHAQIALTREIIKAQGGNFKKQVAEAEQAFAVVSEKTTEVPKTMAQFEKEEELFLKYLDHLDIGSEMFGPFQGETSGEKIVWQSFAETSWRLTNLENNQFDSQVGYWTNRVIFKGIKFPFNTLDPFVEATVNIESNGIDFKDHLDLAAGVEWRPFARSSWLNNFRPWSLPLLDFIKSYRFYVVYGDVKNLKDEIVGSRDYDLQAGVGVFYEWGVDLPPASEGAPSTLPDYIRRYIWGEYFGRYFYTKTNLSPIDDPQTFIFNSSVILGIKLPGIPLPPNPINDRFVFMPYMKFEHVNATENAFPFQNQYFVAAGMRWMPFMSYRYAENEWLSKTKLFAEYVGVGRVKNFKQDGEAPYTVDTDLRFGVNISSRRF
jgi:hypothetical protein